MCLVDKRTYQSLHTILYRSAKLGSSQYISSFCDVVTSSRPRHSVYLMNLQIGHHWSLDFFLGILGFRGGLYLSSAVPFKDGLGNLKSLSPSTIRKAFDILFSGLIVPFQLEAFVHSGRLSKPLLCFEGQSNITKLGCHAPIAKQNEHSLLRDSVMLNPNLIPNLKVIKALLCAISALMPELEWFTNSLAHAMVPTTRICIVDESVVLNMWVDLLKGIQNLRAHSTIKR
ncbi:hypothetical protein B0J17DRAFT_683389 [Rhizoctonia solani]|nr:hypothetical protein B0J17DRAFT_683389 [Rhizoctonia solani]